MSAARNPEGTTPRPFKTGFVQPAFLGGNPVSEIADFVVRMRDVLLLS